MHGRLCPPFSAPGTCAVLSGRPVPTHVHDQLQVRMRCRALNGSTSLILCRAEARSDRGKSLKLEPMTRKKGCQ